MKRLAPLQTQARQINNDQIRWLVSLMVVIALVLGSVPGIGKGLAAIAAGAASSSIASGQHHNQHHAERSVIPAMDVVTVAAKNSHDAHCTTMADNGCASGSCCFSALTQLTLFTAILVRNYELPVSTSLISQVLPTELKPPRLS